MLVEDQVRQVIEHRRGPGLKQLLEHQHEEPAADAHAGLLEILLREAQRQVVLLPPRPAAREPAVGLLQGLFLERLQCADCVPAQNAIVLLPHSCPQIRDSPLIHVVHPRVHNPEDRSAGGPVTTHPTLIAHEPHPAVEALRAREDKLARAPRGDHLALLAGDFVHGRLRGADLQAADALGLVVPDHQLQGAVLRMQDLPLPVDVLHVHQHPALHAVMQPQPEVHCQLHSINVGPPRLLREDGGVQVCLGVHLAPLGLDDLKHLLRLCQELLLGLVGDLWRLFGDLWRLWDRRRRRRRRCPWFRGRLLVRVKGRHCTHLTPNVSVEGRHCHLSALLTCISSAPPDVAIQELLDLLRQAGAQLRQHELLVIGWHLQIFKEVKQRMYAPVGCQLPGHHAVPRPLLRVCTPLK
mmetsp:Transcript_23027/g.65277  ORF Transcript_23027/g.65277 Transcript_23027/m.65277 type:complete len:410 (+) Transcript_23027:780-2009(+)